MIVSRAPVRFSLGGGGTDLPPYASRFGGYVVSAASDLLAKINVAADGTPSFTGDADTTRYIDLNDPANPATSGDKAGKNPQGIAVIPGRPRAYVTNFVSRNVSVIDLAGDRVIDTIRTAPLPAPGSPEEVNTAGAEVFCGAPQVWMTSPALL